MAPETGVCPGSSIAQPKNVASDKGYRGINVLALWAASRCSSYSSGVWGTYQQWSQAGCQVRKGEKATTVVFWKELRKGALGETQSDDDERESRARFFARGYASSTQTSRRL